MPQVIVTAAVNDVEEWLKFKAEMVPAMAAVASDGSSYVAMDGSNQVASTWDVPDMEAFQAAQGSFSPELAPGGISSVDYPDKCSAFLKRTGGEVILTHNTWDGFLSQTMTQTLAVELGAQNIRVNAISPGLVETRFASALLDSEMIRKPFEAQLRQSRERVESARIALREHEDDRLRLQASGHEREHLCRRLIEPLGIVDQAQKRLLFGGVREQAQHREPDEKPIGPRARRQAEGRPERILLGSRQALEPVQQRHAQLVETGEGKLHLRLHANGA